MPFTRYFRNNVDKRLIASAGTAAGVAAAFGSPIGGTLFAFEIAAPTSYWSFELTWALFFTSCVTCFFCSLCEGIYSGNIADLTNSGIIKFGSAADNVYQAYDLISFGIMGVVGGLLGALFCWVNYQMGVWRKKWLTNDLKKFAEVMVILFLTGTVMYWVPLINPNDCIDRPPVTDPSDPAHDPDREQFSSSLVKYLCPDN
jgi:H+/Cl- antiporter ClcA